MSAGTSGRSEVDGEGRERPIRFGLHFCRRYMNLVRYDPDLCSKCPFNGLRGASGDSSRP